MINGTEPVVRYYYPESGNYTMWLKVGANVTKYSPPVTKVYSTEVQVLGLWLWIHICINIFLYKLFSVIFNRKKQSAVGSTFLENLIWTVTWWPDVTIRIHKKADLVAILSYGGFKVVLLKLEGGSSWCRRGVDRVKLSWINVIYVGKNFQNAIILILWSLCGETRTLL